VKPSFSATRLGLNDCDVMIDGKYGSATEQVVRDFQGTTGVLPTTGEVDAQRSVVYEP
jgi:peptidoglycan hydrolase-like protein with peptidoglycan-binding domain